MVKRSAVWIFHAGRPCLTGHFTRTWSHDDLWAKCGASTIPKWRVYPKNAGFAWIWAFIAHQSSTLYCRLPSMIRNHHKPLFHHRNGGFSYRCRMTRTLPFDGWISGCPHGTIFSGALLVEPGAAVSIAQVVFDHHEQNRCFNQPFLWLN